MNTKFRIKGEGKFWREEVLLRRESGECSSTFEGTKVKRGSWWLNSLVNEGLFLALDKPREARTMKLGRIY